MKNIKKLSSYLLLLSLLLFASTAFSQSEKLSIQKARELAFQKAMEARGKVQTGAPAVDKIVDRVVLGTEINSDVNEMKDKITEMEADLPSINSNEVPTPKISTPDVPEVEEFSVQEVMDGEMPEEDFGSEMDTDISTPSVSAPSVSAPSVSAPSVSAPSVSTPSIDVEQPTMDMPSVEMPDVAMEQPEFNIDAATPNMEPEVDVPSVKEVVETAKPKVKEAVKKKKKEVNKPSKPAAPAAPKARSKAPSFTAEYMDGGNISLDELTGKVVVLNFWWTGCKMCIAEMPTLNNLVDKYEGKDVVFLGMCLDDATKTSSTLGKHQFDYTHVVNARKVSHKYNTFLYPGHAVIDKDGGLVMTEAGNSSSILKKLDETISKVLAE